MTSTVVSVSDGRSLYNNSVSSGSTRENNKCLPGVKAVARHTGLAGWRRGAVAHAGGRGRALALAWVGRGRGQGMWNRPTRTTAGLDMVDSCPLRDHLHTVLDALHAMHTK